MVGHKRLIHELDGGLEHGNKDSGRQVMSSEDTSEMNKRMRIVCRWKTMRRLR